MMNKFVYRQPKMPIFSREGLAGYKFPIKNSNLEIYFINCKKGHGKIAVSDTITHFYYILEGEVEFSINNKSYLAKPDETVEIPPMHRFDYSGKAKMLLIMEPPFSADKVQETDSNS